ncbi:hypothetical protein [Parvicella tangerina]|uniref:Outer membrane protein beta-barrel domain-containing protein n=1 Tax=Parvicella tangerina TaxID=2829795 RepID=A0A916JNU9_9FLAO|nr:hypothetical protein [Parvicella tangerina]CAG5084524.1 hypothetical protein CRYO30217_02487 [Parvicella tangerina]
MKTKFLYIVVVVILVIFSQVYAQIPDSLMISDESTADPRFRVTVAFSSTQDFIKTTPNFDSKRNKLGYTAGAGSIIQLGMNSKLSFATSFRFIRSKLFLEDSTKRIKQYQVLPYGGLISMSYLQFFCKNSFINIGGDLQLNFELKSYTLTTRESHYQTYRNYFVHIGLGKAVQIGKTTIYPEVRYSIGINSTQNYGPFEEVKLHFLSLLINVTNN